MRRKRSERMLDREIQDYLSGKLDPERARKLEASVLEEPADERDVACLRQVEEWLSASRSRPSGRLSLAIRQAVAAEATRTTKKHPELGNETQRRERPVGDPGPWAIVRDLFRPRWSTAVGLAAVLIVLPLLFRSNTVRNPILLPPTQVHPVSFVFESAEAQEVCLAADFNKWTVCKTPLQPVGGGLWEVTVELPPGTYQYQFVVDGQWIPDPKAAMLLDVEGLDSRNAVVVVGT